MIVVIDGNAIHSEHDFHAQLARQLDLGPYYGRNLHALRDSLSGDVERPVKIVWRDSAISRIRLGKTFEMILEIFEQARRDDLDLGRTERFEYKLD